MAGTNVSRKQRFLNALEKSLGVVTTASRICKIPRRTHYSWVRSDPSYRRSVQEITDVAIDFVETKLLQRIAMGDTTAIIFYLKTKGSKRGYGQNHRFDERQQGRITIIEREYIGN